MKDHFPPMIIHFQAVRPDGKVAVEKRFKYDLPEERRLLGDACRMAFIAGNTVITRPYK